MQRLIPHERVKRAQLYARLEECQHKAWTINSLKGIMDLAQHDRDPVTADLIQELIDNLHLRGHDALMFERGKIITGYSTRFGFFAECGLTLE